MVCGPNECPLLQLLMNSLSDNVAKKEFNAPVATKQSKHNERGKIQREKPTEMDVKFG